MKHRFSGADRKGVLALAGSARPRLSLAALESLARPGYQAQPRGFCWALSSMKTNFITLILL